MNFDWKKYKRFFTFGCSYTNYDWPSWADIVSKEMPDAEFINLGLSGSGNPLISYRIAEANARYKFTETDLVMVMFTSFTREDRWTEGRWQAHGNVYNSHYYDSKFLRKYADVKGYYIRDASVINLTLQYLDSIPADTFAMLSIDIEDNGTLDMGEEELNFQDINEIYKETFAYFKPSFSQSDVYPTGDNDLLRKEYSFIDGHPSTRMYYEYLKSIGFEFSEATVQYVLESSEKLKQVPTREDCQYYFPVQAEAVQQARKLLF